MKTSFVLTCLMICSAGAVQASSSVALPQIKATEKSPSGSYKGATYSFDKRDCSCVEENLKSGQKNDCSELMSEPLFLARNSTLFGQRRSLGGITEFGSIFVYDSEPVYRNVRKELFGQPFVDLARAWGNKNQINLNPKAQHSITQIRTYDNQQAMMLNIEENRIDVAGVSASVYKLKQKIEVINDKSIKMTVTQRNEAADLLSPTQISIIKKEIGKISEIGNELTNFLLVGDSEHSVVSSEKVIRCKGYR